MIESGLVSITFRQLSPEAIVEFVRQADLDAIEWGGDVHVPHGDVQRAHHVARLTRENGLKVAAYGSYYRVGEDEESFGPVLETAAALGAPRIRVWAGRQGSDEADGHQWQRVIDDARAIAESAAETDIPIVLEYHARTLTDTLDSTRRLLTEVDHPNLRTYWQPPRYSRLEDNLEALSEVLPWLSGLHVFNWHKESGDRLPLAESEAEWLSYLEIANEADEALVALIEFVVDDEPDAFLADAVALKRWLASVEG